MPVPARFRSSLLSALAACALLLAPAAPLHAETITIQHAQGTSEVPLDPKTILVFDLAALDTLDTLGVPVAGVPEGVKPAYLRHYNEAAYPKIGSLFEPDFEAVAAAAPDLIVTGGRSAAKYAELAAIAPTVDVTVDASRYIEDAKDKVRLLARITRREEEAERRIAALDASIAALKDKAKGAGTGLILMTTGGRMSAYGPGSRFGIIHTVFGVAPAAADLAVATHGQAVSYEFILKTDPDTLFVIDRDAAIGQRGQAASVLLDNEIVRRTKAWSNGRVVYLDPDSWYLSGTGLTAMQAMVDEIAAALD